MTRRTGCDGALPMASRDVAHLPGHWLFARLGKRVLRPGGRELTEQMLTDASVDAVIGEAMLTMQTDAHKAEIVAEAFRVLRPGGRYAIHELALTPDGVDDSVKTEIRTALARAIKVNARPLTAAEWTNLLAAAGFRVNTASFAPMALLEPRRVVADEGLLRTLRFVANVVRYGDARARVRGHAQHLPEIPGKTRRDLGDRPEAR